MQMDKPKISRFKSLKNAPSETRRILRSRFKRNLAVAEQPPFTKPEATVISDILAFQLLDRLTILHSDDWDAANTAYKAYGPANSEPPDLSVGESEGWLRQIWGRAKIPREIN